MFENINIPNQEEGAAPDCGSELISNINTQFEQDGRYLNNEEVTAILDRLNTDINQCQSDTREALASVNEEMFQNGVNIVQGWIWEERFLPELGIDKNSLLEHAQNLPREYTFRTSWKWIIFSDMDWNPIINYNSQDNTYEEPGMLTFQDSMDDNVQWSEYVLTEAMLERWEASEAVDWIDKILQDWPISIEGLNDPDMRNKTARLYNLTEENFTKILRNYIDTTGIYVLGTTPRMRLFENGDVQIAAQDNDWQTQIINYHPNGEVESSYQY